MAANYNIAFNAAVAVTPSDTDNIVAPGAKAVTDALFVGTGATELTVVFQGGEAFTFTNVPDGTLLPVGIIRVNDTNTDASDLVALYQI